MDHPDGSPEKSGILGTLCEMARRAVPVPDEPTKESMFGRSSVVRSLGKRCCRS